MTIKLDPRRPIVWRTPHSLQIGVDPVLARLDDVSDADVRLIDALSVGVTRSGLAMLAELAGVAAYQVDELLAGLDAALLAPVAAGSPAASALPGSPAASALPGSERPESERPASEPPESGHPESQPPESGRRTSGRTTSGRPASGRTTSGRPASGRTTSGRPAPPAAIAVVGSGIGAARVAGVLSEAGLTATLVRPRLTASTTLARGRRPAAAVLVSTHVIDPLEHLRWLRRDVPHVPVVFGEAAVTVGPLVEVGTTACLACVEQRRTRDDPARPAISAQLWGTAAAAESAGLATEAAVEALRMLRARILTPRPAADADADTRTSVSVSVRLDADTGDRIEREWWPSERCGCGGLSLCSALEFRRESDSELVLPAPWSPVATTTTRALFVPA